MSEAMTFHPPPHTSGYYEGGIVDDSRVLDQLPDEILIIVNILVCVYWKPTLPPPILFSSLHHNPKL
jgi:hypothetical protein